MEFPYLSAQEQKVLFFNAINETKTRWEKYANFFPSDEESVKLPFLGSVGTMREYHDEKEPQGFTDGEQVITTIPYELTIRIKRNSLKNPMGRALLARRIAELGKRARNHPMKLAAGVIADNGTCYDGKALFADDHPAGESTNDNNLSQTGVSLANIETDFWLAYDALMGFKDTRGELLERDEPEVWIACSPTLASKMRQLQQYDKIGTTSYSLRERFKFDVFPFTSANPWFMFDLAPEVKPLTFIEYEGISYGQITDADQLARAVSSETGLEIGPEKTSAWLKKWNFYGCEGQYVAAPGNYQNGVKVA